MPKKNFDLKSFITLMLVLTLSLSTIALVFSVIFGILPADNTLINSMILLFSNSTTMTMTFFFSKKKNNENDPE